jgi:hypothetical protein
MKMPPRPDEAGNGGGVTWDTKQGERCSVTQPVRSTQASNLLRARQRLDRRTEALEVIANWRDELRERIARAKLRFELVGLDNEEQQALVAEICDFKRICRCLAWPRRRPAA